MAAVSHLPSTIDRPDSRVSLARSDTTYHSFQDLEVPEPEVRPEPAIIDSTPSSKPKVCRPPAIPPSKSEHPVIREIRRQDSGYESITPPRESRPSQDRKVSATSLSSSFTKPKRTRYSTQRSPKSVRNSRRSISPTRTYQVRQAVPQQPETYFHFPQPHFTTSDDAFEEIHGTMHSTKCEDISYQLPPQTTHYWTSDQTRRLEYAAIDAASKGVRGWVMRHVVPECVIPPSKRHLGFEDDSGSVIRYRLSLDGDDDRAAEKANNSDARKGWRSWWFSIRRR
ncbi:hypothetical protein QBC42DRAFT_297251 [Cladorrhinum samala]|uniref:Uncharacterized protein n=1 Tax=Cladorrhinum samala TaxID=585594 RepID=A0AAV9HQ12_9PEZI|nr:hypothetical protein QBC42DRAFT_297251 [Cladorrhinum samala]